LIIDNEEECNMVIPSKKLVKGNDSESEYKLIGLTEFFDVEDDATINWKEYFGIKNLC
jgi:limonene-1,2-epoxide hydrolase